MHGQEQLKEEIPVERDKDKKLEEKTIDSPKVFQHSYRFWREQICKNHNCKQKQFTKKNSTESTNKS